MLIPAWQPSIGSFGPSAMALLLYRLERTADGGNTANEGTLAESQKDCRLVSWCTDDVCNGSSDLQKK